MKFLTILCFFFILQNQLISQTLTIVDDNCFGGSGNDVSEGILKFPNGNTLIYGSSDSPLSGTKNEASCGMNDGWVIRSSSLSSQLQKNIDARVIQARHSQFCLTVFQVVTGPCIYSSLAAASEFVNSAVHLFSLPVHPASSVAALCHPRPHLGAPGSSSLTLVR